MELVNVLFVSPNCFFPSPLGQWKGLSLIKVVRVEDLGESGGDIISLPEPGARPAGSADPRGTSHHRRLLAARY